MMKSVETKTSILIFERMNNLLFFFWVLGFFDFSLPYLTMTAMTHIITIVVGILVGISSILDSYLSHGDPNGPMGPKIS